MHIISFHIAEWNEKEGHRAKKKKKIQKTTTKNLPQTTRGPTPYRTNLFGRVMNKADMA